MRQSPASLYLKYKELLLSRYPYFLQYCFCKLVNTCSIKDNQWYILTYYKVNVRKVKFGHKRCLTN